MRKTILAAVAIGALALSAPAVQAQTSAPSVQSHAEHNAKARDQQHADRVAAMKERDKLHADKVAEMKRRDKEHADRAAAMRARDKEHADHRAELRTRDKQAADKRAADKKAQAPQHKG